MMHCNACVLCVQSAWLQTQMRGRPVAARSGPAGQDCITQHSKPVAHVHSGSNPSSPRSACPTRLSGAHRAKPSLRAHAALGAADNT